MAGKTNIEWMTEVWNPTKQPDAPLRWRKARRANIVPSTGDLFYSDVPFEFIDKVFAVMALCPQHTFMELTKRAERMAEYLTKGLQTLDIALAIQEFDGAINPSGPDVSKSLADLGIQWPLSNLWLGTSCIDQVPHLLKCPATARFLSLEPLLDAVNLDFLLDTSLGDCAGCTDPRSEGTHYENTIQHPGRPISLCIVGGESGPGARPCNAKWIWSIIQQCKSADVPCFVKQLGSSPIDGCGVPIPCRDRKGANPEEWPKDLRVREFPTPSNLMVEVVYG